MAQRTGAGDQYLSSAFGDLSIHAPGAVNIQSDDVHTALARAAGQDMKRPVTRVAQGKGPMVQKPEREVPCTECRQLILGEAVSIANSMDEDAPPRAWHPKCFKCNECSAPISGNFVEAGGFPFCPKCGPERVQIADHNRSVAAQKNTPGKDLSAERAALDAARREAEELVSNVSKGKEACGKCGAKFKATDFAVVELKDATYHANCVECSSCHVKVGMEGVLVKGGSEVMCNDCAKKQQICASCNKPFDREFLEAQGMRYHKGCFKCHKCNSALTGAYAMVNSQPVCAKCASKPSTTVVTKTPVVPAEGERRKGFVVDPMTGKKRYG